MTTVFTERLKAGEVLIADGATGTNYQKMGLAAGKSPEAWVFEAPEKVLAQHQTFIEAGSDIILSNSFGGTGVRLENSAHTGRAAELNRTAAELARQAAAQREGVMVAGSMGPTGALMKPLGPLAREQAVETYAEQAEALAEGGVDFLLVETMFAIEEALAAIEGARQRTDLPLVCSFSFDRGEHTMMGVSPEQMVEALKPLSLAAMGANCGHSLDDAQKVLEQIVASEPGVPLWIKPNAGTPRQGEHGPEYDLAPEEMARYAVGFVKLGAQVVGGCCGSTPEHVRAIAQEVRKLAESSIA
ncbi:MAG: homocysteine S-methyltransferase family protein [Anaerolineales bacterium]|jgi:5-methyltetrahydrofolate--homocysteine methyltransferase